MTIGWLGPDPSPNAVWIAMEVAALEADMDDRIERAWLQRFPPRSVRKRFRWGPRILAEYPLTQDRDICSRCLRWTWNEDVPWELDHLVELQLGGIDHPSNLAILCVPCHRSKPYPPERLWGDAEACRDHIVAWIRRGPTRDERPRIFDRPT